MSLLQIAFSLGTFGPEIPAKPSAGGSGSFVGLGSQS